MNVQVCTPAALAAMLTACAACTSDLDRREPRAIDMPREALRSAAAPSPERFSALSLDEVLRPTDPRVRRWAALANASNYDWASDYKDAEALVQARYRGDFADAARIGEQLARRRVEMLGDDHPDAHAARARLETVAWVSRLPAAVQRRLGAAESAQAGVEGHLKAGDLNQAELIYQRLCDERAEVLSGAPRGAAAHHPEWADSLTSLAYPLANTDQLARAEAAAVEALRTLRGYFGGVESSRVAQAEQNLGYVHGRRGNWLEALRHYDEAVRIRACIRAARGKGAATSQSTALVQSLSSRAVALWNLRSADEAIATYTAALEVLGEADHPERSRLLHNRGELLASLGRHAAAESDLRAALDMRTKAGEVSEDVAYTAYALGELLLATGRPEKGREHHQQALDVREKQFGSNSTSTTSELLASRRRLGEFMLDDGDAARAAEYLQGVLSDAQTRRTDILGDERDRARMAGRLDIPGLCSSLAAAHLTCGDPDAAFDALESGRARALLDLLARRRDGTPADSAAQPLALQPLTAAQVRARLAPGELFLLYSWTPDRVLVAGLRGGSDVPAIVEVLAEGRTSASTFKERIETLGSLIRDRSSRLDDMHKHLLTDVLGEQLRAAWSDSRRVIIAPDGPLALIPFEVLNSKTPESPLYVANTAIEIVYSASASMYFAGGDRPSAAAPPGERTGTSRAAVFGVNNFDGEGSAADHFVRVADVTRATTSDLAKVLAGESKLPPLCCAEAEARAVAEKFERSGSAAALVLGRDATAARFWREVESGPDLLHVATHGLSGGYDPHHAALAFAPDQGQQPFVTFGDLIHPPGRLAGTRLVVLAACSTHQTVAIGDTPFTLSWGFLTAGAEQVVSTLRPINDESAQEFFGEFYTYMLGEQESSITVFGQEYLPGDPLPPAAALQVVRRVCINTERREHPYFWAPFVLVARAPTPP